MEVDGLKSVLSLLPQMSTTVIYEILRIKGRILWSTPFHRVKVASVAGAGTHWNLFGGGFTGFLKPVAPSSDCT